MSHSLILHLDTETTGFDPEKNGVHSLGFIGEIIVPNSPIFSVRPEYLGYWEFNPVGRERTEQALTVGGVTHEELDKRESDADWKDDIKYAIERTIFLAKDRYGQDLEVYMVGSFPQYDINMIEGMNWGWKLTDFIKPEHIIDTKTGYKLLMEEGKIEKTSCSLQNLVKQFDLKGTIDFLMRTLEHGKWYLRYGNANPFERPNPHTAIYDCACTLMVQRNLNDIYG
jgi:hypothetical protein